MLDFGIKRRDMKIIQKTIPHLVDVIPLREVAYEVTYHDKKFAAPVIGTSHTLFDNVNLDIQPGGRALTEQDLKAHAKVCVIGDDIAKALFPLLDPVGESLFAQNPGTGAIPYRIIGVISPVKTAGAPARGTQERNFNREIYVPLTTADDRYGDMILKRTSGTREFLKVELSGLFVVVDKVENVLTTSEMVARVFEKTHKKQDIDIRVPLANLKQAERKKRNQQLVLGVIAAVSLLVGGIGIMNIMLASVTERTREIGIRRALGAKQRHIATQFLVETVVLSTLGGVVGVLLGCAGAVIITRLVDWETIVRLQTVVISFGLSVLIGIFFGMYPAIRASKLDPIEALRYE